MVLRTTRRNRADYWSFFGPPLKQSLKHDRMEVIDQGKEMVLRVDGGAAH